ncbi:MAG: hypothetical protein WAK17_08465 [Candidatus Nitrosopolaris sp.]
MLNTLYITAEQLHKSIRNFPAEFVSLNILSSDIEPLKSEIVRGNVFNVVIHGICALLAAETPSGEFTATASEDFTFSICNATLNGAGSGLPFPSNW